MQGHTGWDPPALRGASLPRRCPPRPRFPSALHGGPATWAGGCPGVVAAPPGARLAPGLQARGRRGVPGGGRGGDGDRALKPRHPAVAGSPGCTSGGRGGRRVGLGRSQGENRGETRPEVRPRAARARVLGSRAGDAGDCGVCGTRRTSGGPGPADAWIPCPAPDPETINVCGLCHRAAWADPDGVRGGGRPWGQRHLLLDGRTRGRRSHLRACHLLTPCRAPCACPTCGAARDHPRRTGRRALRTRGSCLCSETGG